MCRHGMNSVSVISAWQMTQAASTNISLLLTRIPCSPAKALILALIASSSARAALRFCFWAALKRPVEVATEAAKVESREEADKAAVARSSGWGPRSETCQ